MSESMWLKCCQCGKLFEILGELAEQTRAFYAAQPNHPPDKEGGVCDECWEKRDRSAVVNPYESPRTAPNKRQVDYIWPFIGLGLGTVIMSTLVLSPEPWERFVGGLMYGGIPFGLLGLWYAIHR